MLLNEDIILTNRKGFKVVRYLKCDKVGHWFTYELQAPFEGNLGHKDPVCSVGLNILVSISEPRLRASFSETGVQTTDRFTLNIGISTSFVTFMHPP